MDESGIFNKKDEDIIALQNNWVNEILEQRRIADMLLNTIPCAVYSVDDKNIIKSWNRRAEQITGYSKEEIIGKNCHTFAAEPCNEICGLLRDDIAKPIYNKHATIRTKSGEIIQVTKNIDVLRDSNGRITGGIESFEDITQRLKMEQLLKESEERYAAIINSAPEVIVIHKDGKIVFINNSGMNTSGYNWDDTINRSIFDFLTEDAKISAQKAMKLRKEGLEVKDYELDFITKSGAILNLIVKSTAITYEKEDAVLIVLIDITVRRQHEADMKRKEGILTAVAASIKKLLDERDYYSAIVSSFEILGNATEVDRVYLFENEYDQGDNGFTSQKLEWTAATGIPQIDNPELQKIPFADISSYIEPLIEGKSFCGIVADLKNDHARELLQAMNILSVVVLPIHVKGRFWGFIGFDEYKYSRVWTEGEFSSLNAFANSIESAIERRQIELELETSKLNAEAANIMKGQFLANMSHEIRTPINGITGFLELLNSTALDIEQQDYLKEAKTASDMLQLLINNILDFSKIETGKVNIDNSAFNIRHAIEDAVSVHLPKATEKGLDIKLFVHSDVPEELFGDVNRLKQVMNNLLSNAIKFTEQGEVSIEMNGKDLKNGVFALHLKISDTGIGIEESVMKRLFTPFTQADSSTTRKYGGTGLGLAISMEIVKLMGGQISVESTLGQGSVFICVIYMKIVDLQTVAEENEQNIPDILLNDEKDNNTHLNIDYLNFTNVCIANLITRFGLTKEELKDIYLEVIDEFPKLMDNLISGGKDKDCAKILIAAKQLKEFSGTLMIETIYNLTSQLEVSAEKNKAEKCSNLIEEIKKYVIDKSGGKSL